MSVPGSMLDWLRARDAGLSSLRRAARAAILVPGVFALGDEVFGNPTLAVFAAFGAISTLLFVDFTGSMRERLATQASLVLAGAALVSLGTLVAQATWLAVAATVVVAFAALFAGVISSVLASATTALIVGFILPVSLAGPVSSIPDELAGWLMAGALSLLAISVLWPAPTREPLRMATAQAGRLLARRLRAEVDCIRCGFQAHSREAVDAVAAEATTAVQALNRSFFATPYRPTGLTTATRVLVRLVDEVIWLNAILERQAGGERAGPTDAVVCEVKLAAAELLDDGADLLTETSGDPAVLEPDLLRLRQAREAMERTVTSVLPALRAETLAEQDTETAAAEFVSSLEPSFRAQEMSVAIAAIATNIQLTVAARQRTWWQHLLGQRPVGIVSNLSSARERAGAHLQRHSVWLHNSVRGAVALAAAVLIARLTGVQHSFWVVLGTLAVLRSNALSTGQNALRGLLGTVAGFIVGGAIVALVGAHVTVYWALLVPAIFFAGLAPSTISFPAGQAGFTSMLLLLYNIVEPIGWKVGLVRIEDVAIGCAVSLVVGAFFWPRGASSEFGTALAEALSDGARYLRGAVEYGVTRCDAAVPAIPVPREQSRHAAAASRRLDDAFRGLLAERGTKRIPLADVTTLVSAVAVLRLTADAIVDLWSGDDDAAGGDRTTARMEVLAAGSVLCDWYARTAKALGGAGPVPAALSQDTAADDRLIEAVRRDLKGKDGQGTATAVRMIWTADHIDVARRLQSAILGPARAVAAAHGGWQTAVHEPAA